MVALAAAAAAAVAVEVEVAVVVIGDFEKMNAENFTHLLYLYSTVYLFVSTARV